MTASGGGKDPASRSGPEDGTRPGSEAGAEAGSDTGPAAGAAPGAGSGPGPDAGAGSGPAGDAPAAAEAGSERDPDLGAGEAVVDLGDVPETAEVAVEFRGVTRRYTGVVACDRIDLAVRAGEVHAIVGENGAGKSTLMKLLYGLEQPDVGEILVRGQAQRIESPRRAIQLRIGMVHQHFMLVDDFTVAENVVLGAEPRRGAAMDAAGAAAEVDRLARSFGTPLDVNARVEQLSVGQQQRVEILKVLYRGADVLILDEPTAVLVPQEVVELLGSVRELAAQGRTVLFIAHSLDEVLRVADRITVLRDGRVIGTVLAAEATKAKLAEMMVGRSVLLRRVEGSGTPGEPVLRVEGLRVTGGDGTSARAARGDQAADGAVVRSHVEDLDLTVRAGEIYGLAGVEGNGQAELVEALVGLRAPDAGRILLDGAELTGSHVRARRRRGLAYIPEDRHARGMVLQMATWENATLGQHDRPPFSTRGLLRPRSMRQRATELVARFRVKVPSINAPGYVMSGGNQQKLVLAREFTSQPKLLIAAHPTRGLDIGATEFVWQQLVAGRDSGTAVLLISSNLEELLALSDRIGVIYDGRIVAERPGGSVTMGELGVYMTGAHTTPEDAGARRLD